MYITSPLIIFLLMVILFVLLSPGVIINFPPVDNNWTDQSSWFFTYETTLVNALIHGVLYAVIVMSILGLMLPYSNYYAPSHMYHRYKELHGPRAAKMIGRQLKNVGQPSALAGMPGHQTTFWSKMFGKPPTIMSPTGPLTAHGRPVRTHSCPNNYVGSLSPMHPAAAMMGAASTGTKGAMMSPRSPLI